MAKILRFIIINLFLKQVCKFKF